MDVPNLASSLERNARAADAVPLSFESDFVRAEDPFGLFEVWFAEASAAEPGDPNAMTLASVDTAGMPNARIVLLKGMDAADCPARGFVFFTNCESAKGYELRARPLAALLFYWKSLGRQVRIRGTVAPVSTAEADAYFASRPRGSQVGAWASQQSRPLPGRRDLEDAVERWEAKFAGENVPRPSYWSGFRLTPGEIEFWQERAFRLHERVVFTRAGPEDPWQKTLLFP